MDGSTWAAAVVIFLLSSDDDMDDDVVALMNVVWRSRRMIVFSIIAMCNYDHAAVHIFAEERS